MKKNCELTAEERYEQRLVKIKPLLDAFFAWAEELQVSGKNKLVDAVRYTLNEKKYLYTFLEDGDVPIDNNRAENAIRPFTVGRKNWLFNNTERGAKCSALLYSIISTAQANGMDVEKYLTNLFSNPADTILLTRYSCHGIIDKVYPRHRRGYFCILWDAVYLTLTQQRTLPHVGRAKATKKDNRSSFGWTYL